MHILVVGGGTATNAIEPVFRDVAFKIVYTVPVSDNGRSSGELVRVFGGPAIGDARSRLVRLMDRSPTRTLLSWRLSDSSSMAHEEWLQIIDGTHTVWDNIPPYMRAMYRAFLIEIHSALLKRPTAFNFSRASIGNLLITGARLYFGTLEAAIEFVLHTTRIPSQFSVVPCIDSNSAHHIAAKLENGEVIVGQSAISHPATDTPVSDDCGDDSFYPFSHPNLRVPQINFAKETNESLPSPISRVYYVNLYGDEVRPRLSTRVQTNLQTSDAVIFSVGSLYTSIIPVLLLQGFASALPRVRVMLINGSSDRETEGMSIPDQIDAVNSALAYSLEKRNSDQANEQFVTSIVYPTGADVSGVKIKAVPAECANGEYKLSSLRSALKDCLDEKGPSLVKLGDLEASGKSIC